MQTANEILDKHIAKTVFHLIPPLKNAIIEAMEEYVKEHSRNNESNTTTETKL